MEGDWRGSMLNTVCININSGKKFKRMLQSNILALYVKVQGYYRTTLVDGEGLSKLDFAIVGDDC